jgi:hypothetical protein
LGYNINDGNMPTLAGPVVGVLTGFTFYEIGKKVARDYIRTVLSEAEKLQNDLMTLFINGMSTGRVIPFCSTGWWSRNCEVEISNLGPLSAAYLSYFELVQFHSSDHITHYVRKFIFILAVYLDFIRPLILNWFQD